MTKVGSSLTSTTIVATAATITTIITRAIIIAVATAIAGMWIWLSLLGFRAEDLVIYWALEYHTLILFFLKEPL